MNDTTWTIYRTGYVNASDTSGAKILVMNLESNHGKHVAFDWAVGGWRASAPTRSVPGSSRHDRASRARWELDGYKENNKGGGYYYAVEKVEAFWGE